MSTKEKILDIAIKLAEKHNYNKVTREMIAASSKYTPPLISYYFGNIGSLRELIVKRAIEEKIHAIIVQAIANNSPLIKSVPVKLRREVEENLWSAYQVD